MYVYYSVWLCCEPPPRIRFILQLQPYNNTEADAGTDVVDGGDGAVFNDVADGADVADLTNLM